MSQTNSLTTRLKVFFVFIGTFILTASINISTIFLADGSQKTNALMIILSFFAATTLIRPISGGHVNPAVTLGLYFAKAPEIRSKDQELFILYVIAQVLAAVSACFFSYIFYMGNIFKQAPSPQTTLFQAFLSEIVTTFLLVYTILCQGNRLLTKY